MNKRVRIKLFVEKQLKLKLWESCNTYVYRSRTYCTNCSKYLKKVDRAITLDEVFTETDLSESNKTYTQTKNCLMDLEEEGYVSSDLLLVDHDTIQYTTRFYPTDKLHSESTQKIVESV